MKKKIVSLLVCFSMVCSAICQDLQNFTVKLSLEKGGSNYISIADKKAYSAAEAKSHRSSLDIALLLNNNYGSPVLEWCNMSGKDEKIPADVRGTATLINAISLDNEQFSKCNTLQDLKRMTGHISNNSFSHFASVGEKELRYHCFIIQKENGKRGLLWIDAVENGGFEVKVKMEG